MEVRDFDIKKFKPDLSLMKDKQNRLITKGMFIETATDDRFVQYTLKDWHWQVGDKVYPSLKQLFLHVEDPTGYFFANKYLYNFPHWERIKDNKEIGAWLDGWQEELEVKLQAQAIEDMKVLSASDQGNFSASKFLAKREYNMRQAGRPSKAEKEKHLAGIKREEDDYMKDVTRLRSVK